MYADGSSVHQKCSNYALTNLFGLCMSVWIINPLVICLNPHPKAPTRPFTPEMLQARERNPTPSPSTIFTFGLTVESIKEFGGASPSKKWGENIFNIMLSNYTKKIKINFCYFNCG